MSLKNFFWTLCSYRIYGIGFEQTESSESQNDLLKSCFRPREEGKVQTVKNRFSISHVIMQNNKNVHLFVCDDVLRLVRSATFLFFFRFWGFMLIYVNRWWLMTDSWWADEQMSRWWADDELMMSEWWEDDEPMLSGWWADYERMMSWWWADDEQMMKRC